MTDEELAAKNQGYIDSLGDLLVEHNLTKPPVISSTSAKVEKANDYLVKDLDGVIYDQKHGYVGLPAPQPKKAPLTPEEQTEFSYWNLFAFAHIQAQAKKNDSIPPCWLCLSDEAKRRGREQALEWANEVLAHRASHPITGVRFVDVERLDEHTIERWLSRQPCTEYELIGWKDSERLLKQARLDGNPRAFFWG